MKKLFPILIVLAALSLFYQMVIIFFIGDHDAEYSVKSNKNTHFDVREVYTKSNDTYDFIISNKKDVYLTSFIKNYNKQDKVIKSINYYKEGNLKCILPIFKKNEVSNVSCLNNGEQVSYSYLLQTSDKSFNSIMNKIKKEGYTSDAWGKKSDKVETLDNIKTYRQNILEDYVFTMWKYNGIYMMRNDKKTMSKVFINKDQYDNIYATLVGKYYVYFDIDDSTTGVSDIYYYNVKDIGKGSVPLHETLSSNLYINGVYDNEVYITDLDSEKQYKFNPASEKFSLIDGYKVLKENKMVDVKKSDFVSKKVYFDYSVKVKNISNKFGDVLVKESNKYYYFVKDNTMYACNVNDTKHFVKLFSLDSISEWNVKNGDIVVVSKDSVYFYNYSSGLSLIATNPELIYNHKNIVDFYK